MKHVLVRLSGGIIEEVTFFNSKLQAVMALADFVKHMDPYADDASVFGIEGLVANAKDFLDEDVKFIMNEDLFTRIEPDEKEPKDIYVIANPIHPLGFMVASPDDPLGYENPAEAVSELGQMRNDSGSHLKLYRVIPVEEPVITRAQLEQYNKEDEIEDFVLPLVQDYVAS